MRETCEDIIVNKALNFPRMMKQKSNPLLHTMMKKQKKFIHKQNIKKQLTFYFSRVKPFFFFLPFSLAGHY